MWCRAFLALVGLLVIPSAGRAEGDFNRPVTVSFFVTSLQRSYGVLIVAPSDIRCPMARFVIKGAMRPRVSAPIPAGGLVVVRLGAGFALGDQQLSVMALDCPAAPRLVRRVIFGKTAPDHSWRAVLPLADVERHPLRQRQG